MKRCLDCGNLADDDAKYCDVCGKETFEPVGEASDAVVVPLEPELAPELVTETLPAVIEPPAAPPATPPAVIVTMAQPMPEPAEPLPPLLQEAPSPGPPALPAPEPVAQPEPAVPEPIEAAAPAPAAEAEAPPRSRLNLWATEVHEPDEQELEITAEDIAKVKADKWFTIGLVGFPTAGKTWFLNRVKERYSSGLAAYTVAPPKVPQLDQVKGSTVITLHSFALPQHVGKRREGRGLRSFAVLDIPGEAMARAVDRLGSRYDIALGADIVLEAFNACDALIIMMPVDELLFSHELADREKVAWLRANGSGVLLELDGERQAATVELEALDKKARPGRALSKVDAARRETLVADIAAKNAEWREWMTAQSAVNVDKFCDNLGKFANVIHLLQSSNALDIADIRISEIIRGVAKQTEATTTPVLFALSKMDALSSLPSDYAARLEAKGIDEDALSRVGDKPGRSVQELAPGVAKHLTQHFKWLKFECVTAFAGQKQGDLRIDYERNHYGVDAIIEWINRIEAFTSGTPRTVRDVEWARRVGPA
ncbi:MAG TPA: hypothetical protein VHW60_16715 [Caulobacteraceae bacterium]|jgi:hypothetical protein|nr:hypothetical protein [Caulobacteraceae bacterium]